MLGKLFPFLNFWRGKKVFTADLFAGLTVGLVLVPQAMAYAALAGMPPASGLYAASFACIIGALFGRCAQLNTGPVAMTSLLTYAAIAPLAEEGSAEWMSLAAILAVMVGVIRIIVGMLRGTVLVALISQPVLAGFTGAAGITIAATQIPKLFTNAPVDAAIKEQYFENPIFISIHYFIDILNSHYPSLILGVGTLAVMILCKKYLPRWPGLLIGLIGAGLASWLLDFAGMGGRIVGDIPAGLPPLIIPDISWGHIPRLFGAAVLVVIIGLLEVMTVSTAAERKTGERTNLDGEMYGQGLASITAAFNGGFPVSGSLSRSGLNLLAGGITGLSSVISGVVVLFTLLFLTPLLTVLPYPALAAAIVMAVSALIRLRDIINAYKVRPLDGLAGIVTFAITIIAAPNMTLGIICGIGLTILSLLISLMRPRCEVLRFHEDRWQRCDQEGRDHSDQLVMRIDGRAVFLNATFLRGFFERSIAPLDEKGRAVLCAAGMNHLDATGASIIAEAAQLVHAKGGEFWISGAKVDTRIVLERHPTLKDIPQAKSITEALMGEKGVINE